jgi:hypothetical protein
METFFWPKFEIRHSGESRNPVLLKVFFWAPAFAEVTEKGSEIINGGQEFNGFHFHDSHLKP